MGPVSGSANTTGATTTGATTTEPATEPARDARLERREALRSQVMAATPRWYSPWFHLLFPSLVGLGVAGVALGQVRALRPVELLLPLAVWVLANATEWRAHKSLLHHRTPGFAALFEQHTPMHHGIFVTEAMEIRGLRELRLVLIPPYGILLILLATAPFTAVLWWAGQPNLAGLFLATCMLYVLSYEWLHLAYHLPQDGPIGRRWLVRVLRRHHAAHHDPALMQRWNFNVTLPLWDWVRGTIHRPATPGAGGQGGDP